MEKKSIYEAKLPLASFLEGPGHRLAFLHLHPRAVQKGQEGFGGFFPVGPVIGDQGVKGLRHHQGVNPEEKAPLLGLAEDLQSLFRQGRRVPGQKAQEEAGV